MKPTISKKQSLYEVDYQLWLETTLTQLRQSQYAEVDWKNLLEEIEGMTKSDKRALKSLLTRLFEHLLMLAYWQSERVYNQAGWEREIDNFRIQIKDLLTDSPSLKPYLREIFDKCYQDGVRLAYKKTRLPSNTFPIQPLANLEKVLDENWLPI